MKLLLTLVFAALSLWSAPALTIKRQFKQPDGTTFTGRLQGDEYLNWIEAEDGSILLFNKEDNSFEHATIKEEKLMRSGERYIPGKKIKKSPPLQPRVSKEQLRLLWEKKRVKASKRGPR